MPGKGAVLVRAPADPWFRTATLDAAQMWFIRLAEAVVVAFKASDVREAAPPCNDVHRGA